MKTPEVHPGFSPTTKLNQTIAFAISAAPQRFRLSITIPSQKSQIEQAFEIYITFISE